MNKAKFTKGPYEVSQIDGMDCPQNGHRIFSDSGMVGLAVAPSVSRPITESFNNACLFAAAPEMYESLEKMMEWLHSIDLSESDLFEEDWDAAVSALAKARGE